MKCIGIFLLAGSALSSSMAIAVDSDAEFEALRDDMSAMSKRLEELAAENAELKTSHADTVAVVAEVQETVVVEDQPSWSDRISIDGDFRYRYENIDEEGKDERNRSRIRARINTRADLGSVEVGVGLATGGDDPVSANQTLGSGGSSKDIKLNLAYADWTVVDGLHLIAGKFKNPLLRVGKNPLMWDGDWTPEGLAMKYQRGWFFVNALGSWLESDSKGGNSNFSWGGQAGLSGEVGPVKLTGGAGYFDFKTKGDTTYFGDPTDPGDFFGNTAVEVGSGLACGTNAGTTCVYLYDYKLIEIFGAVDFDIASIPVVVFFDATQNSDPDDQDTAWKAGTRVGKTKDSNQWQFSYWYAKKEADALVGLVTDSDWAGGGTDNKGHFFKLAAGINKYWSVGAQYFVNEIDVSSGTANDYNRLILDTQWKFK
jgi:hypothetical protein